ncbi:MAG: hypothetical protein K1Y02_19205 [Candidatus Hydrogenedentes bacterium]|nr:hypothetical protein [Candidatus Hydrogenedentota bacterium]
MAIRRHLLLARQADREAYVQALRQTPFIAIEDAGPWCWTVASALAESHEYMLDAASKAKAPFLLFTTFDGDGWFVSASAAGRVTNGKHEFAKDWIEGNKPAAKRVAGLVALIKSVATDADEQAVADALSGRALCNAEMESDLGDLPRLLHVLGATGIVEIPEDPPQRRRRRNQPTRTLSLLKGHAGRARSAISGVSIPVEHAGDLAALALFCDPDAYITLIAEGTDLPEVTLDIPCKISESHGTVYVEADGGIGLKANVIKRAAEFLAPVNGLEELTIVSGRSRNGKDAGWHRYAGPVAKGRWQIAEATPSVDSAILAAGVHLIGQFRTSAPIQCASESEALAVVNRCAKSCYLSPDNAPRQNGASLIAAKDSRFYVILEIFRIRFAKTWDASAAQKAEAAEKRQWDRLEEAIIQAAEARGLRPKK